VVQVDMMPLTARPRLWRLARLEFDPVRNRRVLLYPEGAMLLNDTGGEVLALCDGTRTVADIGAELGSKYQADVTVDVAAYLAQLVERELVHDAQ
jgi:pyrroloquinoline quinone biosynthesis protein D